MRQNFETSLAAVLLHEGGYVNDPRDPGGATNKGVTQAVYNDYRQGRGMAPQSVKFIGADEIAVIYEERYWDAVRGDELPAGVDYCVFDFAVNSGVNRAARYLQKAAGVLDDGQIGPVTLAAVKAMPPLWLIDAVCAARQAFLESLRTFEHFGRGWTRRVQEVEARAKELAA